MTLRKSAAAFAAPALAAFGLAGVPAMAGTSVQVQIGTVGHPVYVAPAPPVYVVPAPAPVWVPGHWQWIGHRQVWIEGHWQHAAPAYTARPGWHPPPAQPNYHGYGYHSYHGRPVPRGWRDADRDGIPNRFDRDRDGDGVPNRFDRRPFHPHRH